MSLASQLRGRAAARAPATGSSAVLHTTPTPTVRPGPPPSGPPQQQQRHSDFRPQRTHRRHFNFPQRKGRPPSPPPQFRPDKLALRQVGVLPPTVQPEEVQPLKTGLAVTWLGTSSGTPTIERNVSCTVVRAPGHTYLVDCGEGTHRQLPTVDFDMHTIHSIFITHLHGDHCYGLGTTLLAVDEAKAHARSKAIPHNSASPKANDSSLTGAQEKNQEQQQQQQQQQPQQEEPTIYVYGPPGLAELLRAQLVITGSHHAFHSRVLVTELVTNPKDAITTPQPIGPSSSRLHFCRLPPQNMQDQPSLKAASDVLAPRLSQLQTIWRPYNPFKHLPPHQRPRNDPPEPPSLEQSFDGRNFVAAEGLFWDLPSGPMRVMAAQLQHRVPCWGYVLRESRSYAPGMKKRKVTILGDTVNSKAIAPLSLGTDMLAHEATFIEGMEQKCRVAQHSTGWMAGEFAWAVHAKALVLTHFSARYNAWKKGPKGGNDGDDGESAEQEVAMQNSAIRALLAETRSRYRQGNLMAASDFFTFHVPFKVWPPVGQPLRKAAPQSPTPPSTRQQKVSELAS